MNEKKYVMKVKKYDWWKAENGHGETLHIEHAKRFTLDEAKAMNLKWRNRYELIEVKE